MSVAISDVVIFRVFFLFYIIQWKHSEGGISPQSDKRFV